MNDFFKKSSIFFIFIFLLTTIYAIEIESVTSDAKDKGVLGIGDTITFYVKLTEAIDNPVVNPTIYNEGALDWQTEDNQNFSAIYTVVEGQPNLKEPQQLENVIVCKEDSDCTEPFSGEDVFKTIDATNPKLKKIIIPNINKSNHDNYTIEADLFNPEDYGIINYTIIDSESNIIKGEIKLEDTLETDMHIVMHHLDLSSLVDGKIQVNLEIIDDGLNDFELKQDITKITVIPEITKLEIVHINKANENNYSFDIYATGILENAKVLITLENIADEKPIYFEQILPKGQLTNKYTVSKMDTTKLKEGNINLQVTLVDVADNRSKIIKEKIIKDIIVPEISLEKESIFSNSLNIVIKGTVIDKLYEKIIVTYKQDGFEEKECIVKHSPSNTNGYNYATCNLRLTEEGETKIIITTKDVANNISENLVFVKVNTSEIALEFDQGSRFVTNVAENVKEIKGTFKLSSATDANSTYFATLRKLNMLGSKKYKLILNEDNTFVINLAEDPISGTQPPYPFTDGTYIVTAYLKDIYGNKIIKYQKIIIDSVSPKLEINNLETTNRNPELTGKVFDDLEKEVKVVINDITYDATVDGDNWTVQITDTLPLGTHAVKVIAKDEATNQVEETKDGAVIITQPIGGGGGTRITPAAVPAPVETPAEETPVEETAPVETTEPENTNTGGETLTPVETPIETPQLEEAPIVETPTPSGLTGFAGFASSPGGAITIIGGALVVIGAIGYFFFLRPR